MKGRQGKRIRKKEKDGRKGKEKRGASNSHFWSRTESVEITL